jgi:hypothetical protein
LRDELTRKADGLAASPDPQRTLVDDLLEALKNRYRVEGRRSVERLEDAIEHLLRLFRGVSAAQVKGSDVLRYANLRLEEKAIVTVAIASVPMYAPLTRPYARKKGAMSGPTLPRSAESRLAPAAQSSQRSRCR